MTGGVGLGGHEARGGVIGPGGGVAGHGRESRAREVRGGIAVGGKRGLLPVVVVAEGYGVLGIAPDGGHVAAGIVGIAGILIERIPLPEQTPRRVVVECSHMVRRIGHARFQPLLAVSVMVGDCGRAGPGIGHADRHLQTVVAVGGGKIARAAGGGYEAVDLHLLFRHGRSRGEFACRHRLVGPVEGGGCGGHVTVNINALVFGGDVGGEAAQSLFFGFEGRRRGAAGRGIGLLHRGLPPTVSGVLLEGVFGIENRIVAGQIQRAVAIQIGSGADLPPECVVSKQQIGRAGFSLLHHLILVIVDIFGHDRAVVAGLLLLKRPAAETGDAFPPARTVGDGGRNPGPALAVGFHAIGEVLRHLSGAGGGVGLAVAAGFGHRGRAVRSGGGRGLAPAVSAGVDPGKVAVGRRPAREIRPGDQLSGLIVGIA
ncbi:hypothetical protein SDC9_81036 [bioreactor metagenome]|uniref:Uncharacterized protein n=1 Tax=bioreactor metagenome TaxID=1076179 RepID=A0A644Z6V9_9ZZZZ